MTNRLRRTVASISLVLVAVVLGAACDYNDEDEAGVQDARQTSVVYPAGTSDLTAETPPGTTGEVITETIVVENGTFNRPEVTFPAGDAVALVIDNRDDQQYELRIENVATVDLVAPDSLTTAELEVAEPGTYPAVLTAVGSPDEVARFDLEIVER